VPRVRLRQAFASLAQFRGLRFDATPVIDAKAQLEDVQAEYPELARQENVGDVLERIDGILAARVAQTADFYRRTNEPQAAVYNWRYIVENYPRAPRPTAPAGSSIAPRPGRWSCPRRRRAGAPPRSSSARRRRRRRRAAGPRAGRGARSPRCPRRRRRRSRRRRKTRHNDRTRDDANPQATFPPAAATAAMAALPLMAALFGTGCGYTQADYAASADGTPRSLYRTDVRTVAVPIFDNRSFERNVEFDLSKAVVAYIESNTPYKVVPKERADTILEGEITRIEIDTVSNSAQAAIPQEQLLTLAVNFTWKDLRTGRILTQRRRFEQSGTYYPTLGEGRFVGTQQNVERLAVAIVQELQADW
jgi:hypothetical protein